MSLEAALEEERLEIMKILDAQEAKRSQSQSQPQPQPQSHYLSPGPLPISSQSSASTTSRSHSSDARPRPVSMLLNDSPYDFDKYSHPPNTGSSTNSNNSKPRSLSQGASELPRMYSPQINNPPLPLSPTTTTYRSKSPRGRGITLSRDRDTLIRQLTELDLTSTDVDIAQVVQAAQAAHVDLSTIPLKAKKPKSKFFSFGGSSGSISGGADPTGVEHSSIQPKGLLTAQEVERSIQDYSTKFSKAYAALDTSQIYGKSPTTPTTTTPEKKKNRSLSVGDANRQRRRSSSADVRSPSTDSRLEKDPKDDGESDSSDDSETDAIVNTDTDSESDDNAGDDDDDDNNDNDDDNDDDDTTNLSRLVQFAAIDRKKAEERALPPAHKVRSLIDDLPKPPGPSYKEYLAYKRRIIHPNTAFYQLDGKSSSPFDDEDGEIEDTPYTSDQEEILDFRRAAKLPFKISAIESNSTSKRVIRTVVRGDLPDFEPSLSSGVGVKSYIVATDLSPESNYALEWTIGTVLRDNNVLYTICAFEDLEANESDTAENEKERIKAMNMLTTTIENLLKRTRLQVYVVIEVIHTKSPKHLLTEIIDVISPTLVILGSRGRSALKGVLLGSFSNYIVGKSSVPVMVARKRLKHGGGADARKVRLSNNLRGHSLRDARVD